MRKEGMQAMSNGSNSASIGRSWEKIERELFTPEEIAASDLRVDLMGALIEAKQQGISRKRLVESSGVSPRLIAKMEEGGDDLRMETVLKVLASLGKTLAVVPVEEGIYTRDTMEYKGYVGSVEFSETDGIFFGKVLGIRALISYEGKDAAELADAFHEAVDSYLALCEEEGREPEKA